MPIWLASLLGSKWTWIAAAVVVAVTAALLYRAHVYDSGVSAGSAQTQIVVQQKTIEVQRKINDAESKGPRTRDDAINRLDAGTF